jgi:hypothetical protein
MPGGIAAGSVGISGHILASVEGDGLSAPVFDVFIFLLKSAIDDRFVWRGVASNPLEFGHFSMTAERSNRIAQLL